MKRAVRFGTGPGANPGHGRGLRWIAAFEALKGALVLVAGFGLLTWAGEGAQAGAEHLVHHLHLNPARHTPRVFLEAMARVGDQRLQALAALALVYSLLRFVEAYGLYRQRRWAEWLAALSGAVYLPFEVKALLDGVTALKLATFSLNLAVLAYMAWTLGRRRGAGARGLPSAGHRKENP